MPESEQTFTAKYLQIAMALASRIASGEIAEGEKLKGRSVLSTGFNVSPETIRRAIAILSDDQVVQVNAGSGIVVMSRNKAAAFVKRFRDSEDIQRMRQTLSRLNSQKEEIDGEIKLHTQQIFDMYKYSKNSLIMPVEIPLPPGSPLIGKSIGALRIWQNTGVTVIGILQQDRLIISPGPDYSFCDEDRVFIVGDKSDTNRFEDFAKDGPPV